jgi:hypothetical protein
MKQVEERSYYGILEMTPAGAAQGIQKVYEDGEENLDGNSLEAYDGSSPQVSPERVEEVSLVEVSTEEESSLAFTALSVNVAEETTHYRGKTLKQIREGMGIDLKAVSDKTRVSMKVLELIEEEVLEKLPPLVYLKGFLKSYARCLGLNSQKVVEGYLQFLNELKKK